MIVCIAEKPSVAREIAALLGATRKQSGFLEGNGYQVTWVFGHLCTLKEPHEYNSIWKSWSLATLPILPEKFGIRLIENEGSQRQFHVIETLVRDAEMVINCGDAGQEGELIQRWVLLKAGCKVPVKRLWISSLTEESIIEGFKHLRDESEFQSLYEAGMSRAIGDWLLGMNGTRLFTTKYGTNRQMLSIGRVQTPTLAMIVDRFHEIRNFVPVPYWEIKTLYRNTTFSSTKGRFDQPEDAQQVLNQIKDSPFVVTDISTKKGDELPPKLFDLTSLQVESNKKYSFSADETLKLIQSLYEKKLTTYPRVDTTFLSEDIYPKCRNILLGLKSYQEQTKSLLELEKLPKSKKVFDNAKVTDHHAIIPTGIYSVSLSGNELKVYDLITRRFIAVFYPNCKVSTTTVLGEINRHLFKTTGKQILDSGWRMVYQKEETTTDQEEREREDSESILPDFIVGESGEHLPALSEKQTQPPKYYTEATLLRAMETAGKNVEDDELRDMLKENGIGRPSTRAAIIETLLKRSYIRKERKNLLPTETGIHLIAIIGNSLLKSPELTGIWEKKLRQIERGAFQAKQFRVELMQMVADMVNEEKMPHVEVRTTIDLSCPLCRVGEIVKGKSAFGCNNYRNGCDFRLPFSEYSEGLNSIELSAILSHKRGIK